MIGTTRRLKRLFDPRSGKAVILALDHGVSSGMTQGIHDTPRLLELAQSLELQGVVLNKGLARAYGATLAPARNLVVQLSGGTKHGLPPYNKSIVCSIPEALRLGADCVCVQLNIGNDLEDRMLADFGMVSDEAHLAGLPVLAVICACGGQIVNELDPSLVAHCVRLGGELGADIVSTPFSGDAKTFAQAVESCPAPVLVAGGPVQADFGSFLGMIGTALKCGAAGVLAGRNVFERPKPEQALRKLLDLVHGKQANVPLHQVP